MEKSDFVIIGGVAAGPKTAATLARRLPDAKITLFQKDKYLSYATCGMPFFASGEVDDFVELMKTPYGIVRDADFFEKAKGFTAVTQAEVVRINRREKTVTVKNLESGDVFEHGYGKLVIATGATVNRPPFPVLDTPLVTSFTTPEEALNFRRLAERGQIGSVVIVGSGFIGCELVGAMKDMWGIEVTLIEKEKHVLPFVLDHDMAALVEKALRKAGTALILGTGVKEVRLTSEGKPAVVIDSGEEFPADYVFLCMGVHPETKLARECGLEIGETGGILVNEHLQTSDADIYAGGDCIESVHQLTGKKIFLPMGSLANRHGRVIAENLAGNSVTFPGVLGACILKVLDWNIGAVGLTETAAEQAGFDAQAVWASFPDKPEYYPESRTLTLKMVYQPSDNRLLGLQAIGTGDISLRLDVFSSFLQFKAPLDELIRFEHAYAPPFAEALDPLHHMAAIAQARQRGTSFYSPHLEPELLSSSVLWLDVREPEEIKADPLPAEVAGEGAEVVSIPLNKLVEHLAEIEKTKKIVILCRRGLRSYQAALLLKKAGFTDVHVIGGGTTALTETDKHA